MNVEIKSIAKWGEAKKVNTVNGAKILRKATITPEFSKLYKANKEELKKVGVSLMRESTGEWIACWWQEASVDSKSVDMSKATSGSSKNLLCPPNLEYLPYQKAGIEYALGRKSVLLADEMGLGKTIQAIGVINQKPEVKSVIIVAPKTLLLNWKNECNKWLVNKQLTIAVVHKEYTDADIIITNYESLQKFEKQLDRKFDVVILDEAHYIKNEKRIRSKAAKKLQAKMIQMRLTGTPILNRPVELWNIVNDLDPKNFGNFWKFAQRYCNAHRGEFGWDFKGASNLEELQMRLRETVMVRRLKCEVLKDLPAKIRQAVEIEVTKEQTVMIAKEAELKIKYQMLFEPADFAELSILKHKLGISKVPSVVEFVKEGLDSDETKKVFIPAHHKDVVRLLEEQLKQYGVVTLTGDTKEADRQVNVDKFQSDPTTRVFIGTIKAAGFGITLTAANWVVFAEMDEVPGNMNQAEDRCHRIGQKDSVLVQHLVLEGSYDSKNINSLFEKQQIIDKALDIEKEQEKVEIAETVVLKQPDSTQKTTVKIKQPTNVSIPKFTTKKTVALQDALKLLAGEDVDGAMELNGVGFNKIDSAFGRSLARQHTLTDVQLAAAYKMIKKYHRQLPQELFEEIYGLGD